MIDYIIVGRGLPGFGGLDVLSMFYYLWFCFDAATMVAWHATAYQRLGNCISSLRSIIGHFALRIAHGTGE